jgi:DnaJ-domain-containing protein 1
MSSEHVCLSTLRGISARAAAILDRYNQEKAILVPVTAFKQFTRTLYWGDYVDLDLHVLDGLDPGDRSELLDELRAYNTYLRRQRERVSRFHCAYHKWLEERDKELPLAYRERLRAWQQRFGLYDYFRITALGTNSGFQRFMVDPEASMRSFELAFAQLAEQCERERYWQQQAEADGWSNAGSLLYSEHVRTQLEEALQQLGLSYGVEFAEVRRAYRVRAKALHPDRQGRDSTEQMVALNRAYEMLQRFYNQTDYGSARE